MKALLANRALSDANQQCQELLAQGAELEAERAAIAEAKAAAEQRAEALRAELSALRASGTPQGQASKQVVKLSFDKIRSLQLALEDKQVGDMRGGRGGAIWARIVPA